MKRLEKLVEEFMEVAELKHEYIEGSFYWYKARFDAEVASNSLFINADNKMEVIRIFCVNEQKVPEHKRTVVAEFLAMLNYSLTIGSLQMDMSDGEIRYANNVDTEDVEYSVAALKRAVYLTLGMIDRHMPAVMRLIYADFTAEQAMDFVTKNAKTQSSDDDREFDTGSGYVDSDSSSNDSID